jgi:hypothetical protein
MSNHENVDVSPAIPNPVVAGALERFESEVWPNYREKGRGRGLDENQAAMLYRLARARVARDVAMEITPLGPERESLIGELAELGINFEGEVRTLRQGSLDEFRLTGFWVRAAYLSDRTISKVPAVVEVRAARVERYLHRQFPTFR